LLNLVQIGVVTLAGYTWELWFSTWSIFQISNYLSPLSGGLIAYFIATFVFYWWHRARHEFDFYGLDSIRSIIVHKGLKSSLRFTSILVK